MIEIMGKTYLSTFDASLRYGYTQSWFRQCRAKSEGPPYIKLNGKILYDQAKTDEWFVGQMEEC